MLGKMKRIKRHLREVVDRITLDSASLFCPEIDYLKSWAIPYDKRRVLFGLIPNEVIWNFINMLSWENVASETNSYRSNRA